MHHQYAMLSYAYHVGNDNHGKNRSDAVYLHTLHTAAVVVEFSRLPKNVKLKLTFERMFYVSMLGLGKAK